MDNERTNAGRMEPTLRHEFVGMMFAPTPPGWVPAQWGARAHTRKNLDFSRVRFWAGWCCSAFV